ARESRDDPVAVTVEEQVLAPAQPVQDEQDRYRLLFLLQLRWDADPDVGLLLANGDSQPKLAGPRRDVIGLGHFRQPLAAEDKARCGIVGLQYLPLRQVIDERRQEDERRLLDRRRRIWDAFRCFLDRFYSRSQIFHAGDADAPARQHISVGQ